MGEPRRGGNGTASRRRRRRRKAASLMAFQTDKWKRRLLAVAGTKLASAFSERENPSQPWCGPGPQPDQTGIRSD